MAARTLASRRTREPWSLGMLGGAGCLPQRKPRPGLGKRAGQGFLPQQFALVVVSYTELTTDSLRERFAADMKKFALRPVNPSIATRLIGHTYYVRGEFGEAATYEKLKAALSDIAQQDNIPSNHF